MPAHTQIVLPLLIHPQTCSAVLSLFFPKCCPVPLSQNDFHSTGLEGTELKRGELQRVLKECKEYSKTKGLEESEVFSKSYRDFPKVPWKYC